LSDAIKSMIEGQIKPNKVTDARIIEAFETIPRDAFVPKAKREVAYLDEDLEVAPGRFIMEPMVLARLVDAAGIGADEVILDVGCTTGYSTVILAHLGNVVVGLEEDENLAKAAEETLESLGIENGAVITGPLRKGVPSQGPFQVIFLNGAVEEIPDAILDQLADGGRLVTVLVKDGVGRGHMITRVDGHLGGKDLFDASVPFLPGFRKKAEFSF